MRRLVLAGVIATLALAAPANAFDTGAHVDITRDALRAEGVPDSVIDVALVSGWFNDLYDEEFAGSNPDLAGFSPSSDPAAAGATDAASRSHFTNHAGTEAIEAEWSRLTRRTKEIVEMGRGTPTRRSALPVILGASLHEVQDFYAHSNWVEPAPRGPGWNARGFGRTPTWFDIESDTRRAATLYSADAVGRRAHGAWDTNNNRSLTNGMNKDWSGRPSYEEAYIAAYFATRQWVQMVRQWAGETYWREAILDSTFVPDPHDLSAMHTLSAYAGRWQGQGESRGRLHPGPGGNSTALAYATRQYLFETPSVRRAKSDLRQRWERIMIELAEEPTSANDLTAPCVRSLQSSTRFVRLEVTALDVGPDFDPEGDYDPPPSTPMTETRTSMRTSTRPSG